MKRRLCLVILVFFIGCISVLSIPHIFKKIQSEEIKYIQYDELEKMISSQDSFFLIISKKNCPDCEQIKEDIKNNGVMNYFVFEYDINRSESLINDLEDIFPNFVFVPYICYIDNGEVLPYNGNVNIEELMQWAISLVGT